VEGCIAPPSDGCIKKYLIFQLIPNFDGPTVLTKFGIMFLRAPTSAKYLWMSQRNEKKGVPPLPTLWVGGGANLRFADP